MDVVNFDALINSGKLINIADIDPEQVYIIVGVSVPNAEGTKFPLYAMPLSELIP